MLALLLFFCTHTAPPDLYPLSLHAALPICRPSVRSRPAALLRHGSGPSSPRAPRAHAVTKDLIQDRKSTRLNSSHSSISYAVFCLKKKKSHNKHYSE